MHGPDDLIFKMVNGTENHIIYRFAQIMIYAVAPVVLFCLCVCYGVEVRSQKIATQRVVAVAAEDTALANIAEKASAASAAAAVREAKEKKIKAYNHARTSMMSLKGPVLFVVLVLMLVLWGVLWGGWQEEQQTPS